jgi:hypothetical protein
MSGKSENQMVNFVSWLFCLLLLTGIFSPAQLRDQGKNTITINETRFELNGKHFEFKGVSFFNAIYNTEFNKSSEGRRQLTGKYNEYGIQV